MRTVFLVVSFGVRINQGYTVYANLPLITAVSDTLCFLKLRSSTSRRHLYSPPSLTPTFLITRGPRKSSGFLGSGFRRVCSNTPSLYHETLFNGVTGPMPSVTLHTVVTLSPCCRMLTLGTDTLGISSSKNGQKNMS